VEPVLPRQLPQPFVTNSAQLETHRLSDAGQSCFFGVAVKIFWCAHAVAKKSKFSPKTPPLEFLPKTAVA